MTVITLRRIQTTESDDHLSMITSKGIAAAIVGIASVCLVGVALANEAEGPDLVDQVDVVAGSCETTTTTLADESTEVTTEAPDIEDSEDDCEEPDAGEVEGLDEEADDVEPDALEADVVEGEHPLNHGFYVTEATRTCPESGRERGQCISEVAKSDLGKPGAEDTTVTDEATPHATVEEAPAPSSKPTTGHGQTKVKSQGKAKGKG